MMLLLYGIRAAVLCDAGEFTPGMIPAATQSFPVRRISR